MPPASSARNHRVGQMPSASSTEAEIDTGCSGSRSGCADNEAERVPHQDAGSACGTSWRVWEPEPTCSPASRRNRTAAACRSGSLVAGSARVRRSSATRPSIDSGRLGRPMIGSMLTPSSSRKREGCSPSSSGEATAVTTSRSRARVAAT